jgi:hypothetical protein
MSRPHVNEDGDGIISLVRETADGLGRLIADHIRLARVEMSADVQEYGKKVAVLVLAASFLAFGYAFAWIAAALAVGRWIGAPLAFLAVAALHVAGGGLGLSMVLGKLRKGRLMGETRSEVSRSVTALSAQVGAAAGDGPARVPSPQ